VYTPAEAGSAGRTRDDARPDDRGAGEEREGNGMTDRLSAEAEMAWGEFHRTVDMTAQELRTWPLNGLRGGSDGELIPWRAVCHAIRS
jgi:hypothetical protein